MRLLSYDHFFRPAVDTLACPLSQFSVVYTQDHCQDVLTSLSAQAREFTQLVCKVTGGTQWTPAMFACFGPLQFATGSDPLLCCSADGKTWTNDVCPPTMG